MGRHKKMRGEGLTASQAERRVYPKVGDVNSLNDVRELIKAIENDNISENLKRERLQFMFSLTSSAKFKKQFKGDIGKARSMFERAYKRHMKK